MINKELVKYSLKYIMHRKARSIITIFSILIGIATIFIFISFGQGLFDYVNELKQTSGADKLMVLPKGGGAPGLDTTFALTRQDIEAVKKAAGVYDATGVYIKITEVKERKNKKFVFLMGYEPENDLITEISGIGIIEGRALKEGDDQKAVLGYNYMLEEKIFPDALNINDDVEISDKKLKIVGFFEGIGNPQDDSNIYVTDKYFEEIYPNSSGKYNEIIARVDSNNIDQIAKNIEKKLRASRNLEEGKEDFYVSSFEDLLKQFTTAIDYVVYFVIFIALISVVVSAVNTANTTITSVLERVKEIGVMKAIGAKNSDVFAIFVFESGFLGFVAGLFGILVGFITTSIAKSVLNNLGWGFLSPHYSWQLFLGCILFATLTGAISGIIPAWRASKIRPVRALRYE